MGNVNYNEVLNSLANVVANISIDEVDNVIIAKLKEYGISPDGLDQVTKALELINKTAVVSNEMQQARREGVSRSEFIEDRIRTIIGSHSEEERDIIYDAINSVITNSSK